MPRTTFACPECGGPLTISQVSSGREVRCMGCGAPVEVPFLPRAADLPGRRSQRPRAPRMLKLAWALAGLLAIVILAGAINRYYQSRINSGRESRLNELLASAQSLEKAGRFDRAFIEAEAALAMLRTGNKADPKRAGEVAKVRDRLSVLEARQRLNGLDQLEPRRAVADCLTLKARSDADRALVEIRPSIDTALDHARQRQADAELLSSKSAIDDGRAVEALGLLEGVHTLAEKMNPTDRRRTIERVESQAHRLVGTHGLNLATIKGEYLFGSVSAYDAAHASSFLDAARVRGYLVRPQKSPFAVLWDSDAPYRLALELSEYQTGLYLQSKSRVSEIRGILRLHRGEALVWQADITGRTRVPVEGLPAYLGSRLAVSDKREPEAERRLYDDAFASFGNQLSNKLKGLPVPVRN